MALKKSAAQNRRRDRSGRFRSVVLQNLPALPELPEEVGEIICQFLPRVDLKSLRRVSQFWSRVARQALFETFCLKVHVKSYDDLWALALNRDCRKCVQVIHYDGRVIPIHAAAYGYYAWRNIDAGKGFGLPAVDRRSFIDGQSEEDIQKSYHKYCEYAMGQSYILTETDIVKKRLVECFEYLPRIRKMRYTLTHNGQLSSLGKRIMAEPTSTRDKTHIDEQFWVFLESLCIHHSSHLNSIHGDELDLKRWNSIAASHTCHRQLPELHELSLEFRKVRHEKEETPQLAAMIAQAGSLRKLRLSFDVLTAGKPGFDVHLPDVIGQGLHLRFLGNLSLMGVRTTEPFLRELMRKLSGTLSSLELEEISFETADSEWAEPEMVELECNWSWVHFLGFLAENMSLKHAKFDGELSSGQEQWEVGHDGTEGAQSSNHACLKCRIERYVTHQGPNPFPANMKYFEQDYSWHSYGYDDSIYD